MTDRSRPFSDWESALSDLAARRVRALGLGGEERIAREHRAGRQTARERLASLVDDDSFREVGILATAGYPDGDEEYPVPASMVCGLGRIDERPVAIGAEDYTVRQGLVTLYLDRRKGALGGFVEELAYKYRIPLVLLLQGVGGDVWLQEHRGYMDVPGGEGSFPMFDLLGLVPVVTAVMGPCAGGSAMRAVVSHFSLMVKQTSFLFAGGPKVVKSAIGIDVTKEALGGWETHGTSGVIDNVAEDEEDALVQVKRFLSYLPRSVYELPPIVPNNDPADRVCQELLELIPENRRRPYDMRKVIAVIFDEDTFFEISPSFGRALICGLARLHGRSVGVLANNPWVNGGALDAEAGDKQVRFVDMCDTFHIPLVYLADTAGVMLGPAAEAAGTMRRVTRGIHALHSATVPLVSVIVGKAYGVGGMGTNSQHNLGLKIAWPTANWSGLPIESGVEILYGRRIAASPDPEKARREIEAHLHEISTPWKTAENFAVEDIIDPRETRRVLIDFLDVASTGMTAGPKQRMIGRP